MKNDDLKELFERMKEKRDESFQELFDEYFRTIYGIAFTISQNEEISHDAVQNVLASGAFSLVSASVFGWRLWNFMNMRSAEGDSMGVSIESISEPVPLSMDISLAISGILLATSVVVFSCLLVKKIKQSK